MISHPGLYAFVTYHGKQRYLSSPLCPRSNAVLFNQTLTSRRLPRLKIISI